MDETNYEDNLVWMYINGYHVSYDKEKGYVGYIKSSETVEEKKVFEISQDGIASINTQNGNSVSLFDIKIDDFKKDIVFIEDIDGEHLEHYFSGEAITSTKIYNKEGNCTREIIYNNDNSIIKQYNETGDTLISKLIRNNDQSEIYTNYNTGETQYSSPFGEYYCTKHADGSMEYLNKENYFIIYPDGTYVSDDEKGTYTIDKDGNIVCTNEEGNQIYYNKLGYKYQIITSDGSIYYLNNDTKIVTKNGKKTYSMISHIEYDEESYNKILNTLNSVDGSSITSNCGGVVTTISQFPDGGYSSNISTIESNINNHINLVKSLGAMTNYSLLAYQSCDEDLRKGLYLLIDSLFGDNDLELANRFKRAISPVIEDKDNDKILEYKENVNFKVLSNNEIVSDTYTDENGNIWYLNKNNRVIGMDGKNIKLNYGGETFNVIYDKNGIIKLTDSNGNPLNIFGDYNIDSKQFGGAQDNVYDCFTDNLNHHAIQIAEDYYPDANKEELQDIFSQLALGGCGNMAMTNIVFKKFEGNEDGFYDTFGYTMYDIKYDKSTNGLTVDYNYEPLAVDLFCHERKNGNIKMFQQTSFWDTGTLSHNVDSMINYLKDKYNVSLKGFSEPIEYYGEKGYILYNMDGSIYTPYGDGHAMVGIGRTNDGKIIVSSWGEKLILELSTEEDDIKMGQEEYRKFI